MNFNLKLLWSCAAWFLCYIDIVNFSHLKPIWLHGLVYNFEGSVDLYILVRVTISLASQLKKAIVDKLWDMCFMEIFIKIHWISNNCKWNISCNFHTSTSSIKMPLKWIPVIYHCSRFNCLSVLFFFYKNHLKRQNLYY